MDITSNDLLPFDENTYETLLNILQSEEPSFYSLNINLPTSELEEDLNYQPQHQQFQFQTPFQVHHNQVSTTSSNTFPNNFVFLNTPFIIPVTIVANSTVAPLLKQQAPLKVVAETTVTGNNCAVGSTPTKLCYKSRQSKRILKERVYVSSSKSNIPQPKTKSSLLQRQRQQRNQKRNFQQDPDSVSRNLNGCDADTAALSNKKRDTRGRKPRRRC